MFHTANPGPENGPVMHLALLAQTALGEAACRNRPPPTAQSRSSLWGVMWGKIDLSTSIPLVKRDYLIIAGCNLRIASPCVWLR
jgi:hypothetical protein